MPGFSFKFSFNASVGFGASSSNSIDHEREQQPPPPRPIRRNKQPNLQFDIPNRIQEMPTKVFLTGVTGYIGGEAFADVYEAHPDWEYSLLVRSKERAKSVRTKYPNVRLVVGSLDDADVIEQEAAAADIVIHTAESADNVPSAKAIAKGLAAGHSEQNPGYWIHISGTGILTWYDVEHKRYGQPPLPDQTYNDVEGIDRILSLPDSAYHRDVEKIVQAANSSAVRTAILAPPTIYGTGRGPVNTRSIQVPDLAAFTLEKGFAPVVGTGATEWDNVHVRDLGRLFVAVAEGTRDKARAENPELYGPRAYYFVRKATHRWGDVARGLAEAAAALGYLPAPLTKAASIKEVVQQGGVAGITWATNSRSEGERAKKYFGWAPREKGLEDDLKETIEIEAKRLGLVPHEKKSE